MPKIFRYATLCVIILTIFVPQLIIARSTSSGAYTPTTPNFEIGNNQILNYTKLGNQNPVQTASYIINWALTLIGMFFMLLMLYGGFIWMKARGNESETDKAKNTIVAAVIGVVIILAAYGISTYLFTVVYNITKAT